MELNEWSVVATIGAAIGTTASAVVVAFQAVYTKRSAQSAEAAVAVAQDTLREAQIARLDARAPQLIISASRYVMTDVTMPGPNLKETTVEDNTIFRLPRDESIRLRVLVDVEIRNDGQVPIELKASSGFRVGGLHRVHVLIVEPNQVTKGEYKIEYALSHWIGAHKYQDKDGEGTPTAGQFVLSYRGPNDSDVDAVYTIKNSGSIVEPVPDQEGSWRITGIFDRELTSTVMPAVFTYHRSRTRGDVIL
ncbi:hypothetical protein [Frigoribacterium faeni]|uniref:Uncharacterized protein n=1 Tax=Frigoribacterium faeni TaxID=145483 RepID=A0A7W3JGH8_9MICO|nr:hypothetical protein [Frigoribacterium faeni]MBA8812420.1 hypothetical protein [Frigoribacterium faeni]BFF13491.1 hypothetical protein GCM10025699_47940 [Microbacterium flavescens]GEK81865.1 hypothetical protein FFA01_01740 [Frigoribacterium faeni]